MKKPIEPIVICNIVMILGVFLLNAVTMAVGNLNASRMICFALILLILLFALIYMLKEYKKDGAIYFKTYAVLNAVSLLFSTYSGINEGHRAGLVMSVILAALFLVLGLGKNLGVGVSYGLVVALILVTAIKLVYLVVTGGTGPSIVAYISRVILAYLMGLMIYEKYRDKENRGTK